MEKYNIKSTFTLGNQVVHVGLENRKQSKDVLLPIKFAPVLTKGEKFTIFTAENKPDLHIAYKFGKNLCFAVAPCDETRARAMYDMLPGIRRFKLDKIAVRLAVWRAIRANKIKTTGSFIKNVLALQAQNQK